MKSMIETINLVTKLHDGQYRKKTEIPYISHPFGVMALLLENGLNESILKTALLHDTLEDTKYTFSELERDFGVDIASYVKHLSEDKSKSWEIRKKHTIENISGLPKESQWVLIADKINNLEMNKLELDKGELNWDKFNRGKVHQEWYYKSIYKELIKEDYLLNHSLLKNYKTLVLYIFDGKIGDIPEI